MTANIATDAVASKTSSASDLHGKPAKTHFKVLAHFAGRHGDGTVGRDVTRDGDRWNTFAISIRTGRGHQIRAHLCPLGTPIVTDCKYAPSILVRGADHLESVHDVLVTCFCVACSWMLRVLVA